MLFAKMSLGHSRVIAKEDLLVMESDVMVNLFCNLSNVTVTGESP